MCILAPLLWRSFFVCIVFGCWILRILYQARYFFPNLTYLSKSGATDGGHAPEQSQRPYQNHGLFRMKTWNNTEHIITFSCTSLTKRWIERAQTVHSLHVPSPTHWSPSNSADCCSCFVSACAFLIMVLSFGGTCRSATSNDEWIVARVFLVSCVPLSLSLASRRSSSCYQTR